MEIKFKLREEDYINFNIDHAKKSASLKKNLMLQRVMGPIIFLAFPFLIKKQTEIPMWYWITIFSITSIVWFVFYPRYFNWRMKKSVRKMLKEGSNKNLFSERKIKILETGILETTSIGETNLKWDQIDKIEETDDYIYIYISSISAHIIPKRIFKNENEKQIFLKEILKYKVR